MLALAAGAALSQPGPTTEPADAGVVAQGPAALPPSACRHLAASRVPASASERRLLIQQLDLARGSCKDHPELLALLGSLWLDEGEPAVALLWLERALMLDPALSGARVDLALTLARLGDDTARQELLREWKGRTDVPAPARARLLAEAAARPSLAAPAPAAGRQWAHAVELTLLGGWESNLDRSPRLTELTITPPDGPVDLPLERPLQPRPGAATLVEVAYQLAHSPQAGTLVQAGVHATGRWAPSETSTDWRHLQAAASVSQRLKDWKLELRGAVSHFGGPLNSPYRATSVGFVVERPGLGCSLQLGLDSERRAYRDAPFDDGSTTAVLSSAQCRAGPRGQWTVGIAARAAQDRARTDARAGGDQRQLGGGLKVSGPLLDRWVVAASLRWNRSLDAEGYSPLLESDSRRATTQWHASVELMRPVGPKPNGLQWVVQVQGIRQMSNLQLFSYRSTAAMTGFRWAW